MTTLAAPREIRRALGRVGGRWRILAAARGVGTVALVAAIGLVVGVLVDFAVPMPTAARWGVWGAWVGVTAVVAIVGVVRPLVRRLDAADLAALAERGQPELGERLVGSVDLLASGRAHGSPALIDALTNDAAERARAVDPSRAVPANRAVGRLMTGAVVAGLVAMPPLLRPDPFGAMARRFLMPWVDTGRVGMVSLEVAPGDAVVAIGSDVNIEATATPRVGFAPGLPDAARLEWEESATGASRRVRMARREGDSRRSRIFEARLPRLDGDVHYRVTTDALASPHYEVKAVEPPRVDGLVAVVEPPAYTRLPAGPVRDPSKLDVVEGTAITFTLGTNRPVQVVELGWPTFDALREGSRTIEATSGPVRVTADEPGSYTFTTRARRDEYGLEGPAERHRLVVRPDRAPVLALRLPDAKEANPDDVLSIPMEARDDFAVASAELHYTIRRANGEGIEPATIRRPLAPEGLGTPRARGHATVALGPLELNPGDILTYKIRVEDNRPGPRGPNVTWSAEGSLAIVAKAEAMVTRADRLRREGIKDRLEEIKKENAANRQEAAQLRYAADAARRDPKAWDKGRDASLADRAAAARKTIDDLARLADDLAADPSFRPLADPAREVADVEAEAGRGALEKAAKAPDAAGKLAELKGADARLGAVHQRIEDLQRQFAAMAKADAERQRLRELAAREDALADRARQAAGDPAALANLRAEQDDVRKEFDALAAVAPDLKAATLDDQAKEAEAMAAKARDLAARQRDEARKTAEGARREGALRALAEEQRKLEVDARRLAMEVDQPLQENGRGGLNPQPLREAVAPIERGEIEGGRRKLEEAEAELRKVARDAEEAPADPKALALRLARRQEALARQVAEAVGPIKAKNSPSPAEREALGRALRPLIEDQAAILGLAEALKVDEPRRGPAREAVQAVGRALEALRGARAREADGRQDEARKALYRLAEVLPDPWRRAEPALRALDEARRMNEEVARDLERDLRETDPARTDRPRDPARSAAELARRLEPLARKEAEVAAKLAAIDAPPRAEPQRRRAEHRARELARAVERLRQEAAPLEKVSAAMVPIRDWRIVGPFAKDAGPPFPVGRPIREDGKFKGVKGQVAWKPARGDDRGKVDLGSIYGREDNRGAFAWAEFDSPEAGVARFATGSDDTLAVWVNGKQVFKVNDSRAFSPEQDHFEAALVKGTNRVIVRCGNGNGEWMFAVAVAPPSAREELTRVEMIRRALPQAVAEERAALARLGQKLHGQTPADDVAEELADEAAEQANRAARGEARPDPEARREAADEARRIATALRGLDLPDAPALQAEAVRRAEAAARALDAPEGKATPEAAKASDAARALADRLADRLAPRGEAKALAEAERAMKDADPGVQERLGRDIAAQVARLEQANPTPHPNPPPQGGRGPERPSALEGEARKSKPSPPVGEGRVGGGHDQPPQAPSQAAAHLAELARRAAHPTNDPNRPAPTGADLAAAGAEAAAGLDRLAEGLPDAPPMGDAPPRERALPDAPRDPELDPLRARAEEAKALARRERQIRERLQAVLGERVPPQEDLRREAATLGRELAGLRDRSREPGPSGRGHADAAASLMNDHAARQMGRAIEEMAAGHADQARGAQREAAELVERAGQAAEDLARALRHDRPAGALPAELAPARDALAEARRRLAEPGEGPGPGQDATPGDRASSAMQRAAQAMRAAARPGPGPGDEALADDPGPTPDPESRPAGVATPDETSLPATARAKSSHAWGELPGHLRTEILQLSQGKYRDDYARQIRLYFKEIAADGAKSEGGIPQGDGLGARPR